MTETLAYGYSSESTQQELSYEHQHDRVKVFFKNPFDICLGSTLKILLAIFWCSHRDRVLNKAQMYRILPIRCTVQVEVGKIFCGRGAGNLPFDRTQ